MQERDFSFFFFFVVWIYQVLDINENAEQDQSCWRCVRRVWVVSEMVLEIQC